MVAVLVFLILKIKAFFVLFKAMQTDVQISYLHVALSVYVKKNYLLCILFWKFNSINICCKMLYTYMIFYTSIYYCNNQIILKLYFIESN